MKSVAICGSKLYWPVCDFTETVEIEAIPVTFGLVETKELDFNSRAPENRCSVLVKISAFSCNYRDKALILSLSQRCRENSFYFIGSEFVGEVIDTGPDVTKFHPGDRVIANSSWHKSGVSGVNPGIPTNHASKRYHILHEAKLIKVPREIPDEIAATFGIGAQTTYSMLRKLNITKGSKVLVTAAKSNTSLFAINALKKYNVDIYGTTTSIQFERELKEIGVKELIQIDAGMESFLENERIKSIVSETGGFDCVIDPFFDLHIGKVVDVMAYDARYVTCGLYEQYSQFTGNKFIYKGKGLNDILKSVMIKNMQIIGNCIGQAEDLSNAIQDYVSGSLKVTTDSTFKSNQVGAFFNRTYNAKDRFGKVVYKYD